MAEEKKTDAKKSDATVVAVNDKKKKHPTYYKNVKVIDINGYEFEVSATVPGPIRVESSHMSHPAYNPDKKVEKVAKGRVEQYNERMKRMQELQKLQKKKK